VPWSFRLLSLFPARRLGRKAKSGIRASSFGNQAKVTQQQAACRREASAATADASGDWLSSLLLQRFVAFARHRLESIEIEYLDCTTAVTEGPTSLYFNRHFSHRCSSNAEHFRKKFLRQVKSVALGAVARLQEPSAEPLFHTVQSVAGSGDTRLLQKHLVVADAQIGNRLAQ
jgi:hypothetical protein